MTFGENLKNLRTQRGFSQQRVADELGMSQSSVASYENSTRTPPIPVVQKFADYFHVSIVSLLTFEKETNSDRVVQIVESLHANPKLRLLFDRSKFLSDSDLDAVLGIVNAISRERDPDE